MDYKMSGMPCKCGTEKNEGNQNKLVGCANGKRGCRIIKMSPMCKKTFELREPPFQFVPIIGKPILEHNNLLVFMNHEYNRKK